MAAPNVNNKNQVNNTALTDFKAGTKRSQMKSDVQKSIFDSIDTNHDGIISKGEMKGIVDGKVKNKNGKLVEKQYIKLKDLGNGRSLVVDSNGKQLRIGERAAGFGRFSEIAEALAKAVSENDVAVIMGAGNINEIFPMLDLRNAKK